MKVLQFWNVTFEMTQSWPLLTLHSNLKTPFSCDDFQFAIYIFLLQMYSSAKKWRRHHIQMIVFWIYLIVMMKRVEFLHAWFALFAGQNSAIRKASVTWKIRCSELKWYLLYSQIMQSIVRQGWYFVDVYPVL